MRKNRFDVIPIENKCTLLNVILILFKLTGNAVRIFRLQICNNVNVEYFILCKF